MAASGQLNAAVALLRGKEALTLFSRRLGGPQSWSRHSEEEKNVMPLPGTESWLLSHPAHSIVTQKLKVHSALFHGAWNLCRGIFFV